MERIVHVTFGVHVPLDNVATMVTALGACAMVRATDDSRRGYIVTVQRPSAMAHVERRLAEWEKYGFISWRVLPPDPAPKRTRGRGLR